MCQHHSQRNKADLTGSVASIFSLTDKAADISMSAAFLLLYNKGTSKNSLSAASHAVRPWEHVLAAKSTALRCAHSPNRSGFASFARLAQRLLARPRTKIEYLEVPFISFLFFGPPAHASGPYCVAVSSSLKKCSSRKKMYYIL